MVSRSCLQELTSQRKGDPPHFRLQALSEHPPSWQDLGTELKCVQGLQ